MNYDADSYIERMQREADAAGETEVPTDTPAPTPQEVQENPLPGEAVPQPQAQPEAQGEFSSPAEAAAGAEYQPGESGAITDIGNRIMGAIDAPQNAMAGAADWLNENLPANPVTQFLDDNITSADEYREKMAESSGVGQAIVGAGEGVKAGLLAPLTIAGKAADQDTPWSRAPEVIQDNDIAETVFNIAEVVTPTLIVGLATAGAGLGPAAGGTTGLLAESALETGLQDGTDDLILGRQVAQGLGEIGDYIGIDGTQLTQDLIENRTPDAQVFNAALGFMQNLGINWGVNKMMNKFFPNVPNPPKANEESAARVLGKSAEDVKAANSEVTERLYTDFTEVDEAADIDSVVPTGLPTEGNVSVNSDSAMSEILRPIQGAQDLVSTARSYFTNYKPLANKVEIQRVIDEVTLTLDKLKDFPEDLKIAGERTKNFWNANKELIDDDLPQLTKNFFDTDSGLIRSLDDSRWSIAGKAFQPTAEEIQEKVGLNASGYMAAAIVGEELGIKIQKSATEALRMETAGVDFTAAMENLMELHDAANMFFVPLRRSKRQWAVDGMMQQRNALEQLRDADIVPGSKPKDVKTPGKTDSFDTPFRDLTTIKKDYADPGLTLREMYEAAKNGDDEALSTLKYYLNYIAYTEPEQVMKQVDTLTDVLATEWAKGNKKAINNLYFASMLSGPATQTASAMSTIIRSTLEPLALMGEGIITANKAQAARGFGSLVGGFVHMGDSFNVALRAFKQGSPINSGSKLDQRVVKSLAQQQVEIEKKFKGLVAQAEAKGEDTFGILINKNLQMLATNPYINAPMRFLMAGDEFGKTTFAYQTAYGRAFESVITDAGGDVKQVGNLIDGNLKRMFKRGQEKGVITDSDVLHGAQKMTFQADIPNDAYNNPIDNAFLGLQEFSKSSFIGTVFLPFTRMSFNALEASVVTFAGMTPMTRWALSQAPRYKAIINGTDDVAKTQLKSMFAAGQLLTMSSIGLAATGNMTGNNVENTFLPRTSFIIPATNEKGYIAIDYSRIEPYASLMSVMADAVNSFRYGAISRGEYEKIAGEATYSLGMAFTNKPFLQGLFNISQILNIKNMNENYVTSLTGTIAGMTPTILRQAAKIVQPYQTVVGGDNMIEDVGSSVMTRALGGVGLPIMYDQYTGNAIPRVGTATNSDNYWAAVGGSIIAPFAPGRSVNVDKDNPAKKFMREVGWEPDQVAGIKTYKGIKLSLDEQSILSKDMHTYGHLQTRVDNYIKEQGNKLFNAYKKANKMGEHQRAEQLMNKIRMDLRKTHNEAKKAAINEGRLSRNPEYRNKFIDMELSNSSYTPPEKEKSGAEALIAWNQGNPAPA